MPGSHVNDQQKKDFTMHRRKHSVPVSAAKAGLSRATGYRPNAKPNLLSETKARRGRRGADPLADIIQEVEEILQACPRIRAVAIYEEIRPLAQRRHNEDARAGGCARKPVQVLSGARGQANDILAAPELLKGLRADALLGDRAFDANWIGMEMKELEVNVVIPPKSSRIAPMEYDKEMYKWRHLIENFFQKIKMFRGIAMRFCKTDESFEAFICLAAVLIHLR